MWADEPLRLARTIEARHGESGMSLILRAFQANGVSYSDGMHWMQLDRRRCLGNDDIPALAWGLRCDPTALAAGLVLKETGSAGAWVHLSGHRFSPWVAPGKMLTKLCPQCLRADGYASLTWLIRAVPACRRHGYSMTRQCGHCRRPISWNRPGIDVCRCLRVFPQAADAEPLETEVQAWIDAVHSALAMPPTAEPFSGSALPLAIRGMSVDGAFRLVEAFGLLESSWSSIPAARAKERDLRGAGQVIARGLQRLHALEADAGMADAVLACVHWPLIVLLAESAAAIPDLAAAKSLLELQRRNHTSDSRSRAPRIKSRDQQQLLDLR
ncbi:TniQ family protein [Roseateles sp. DB2]|uniref:TniQ family protein n=1 Tax=Roseateles sp. DB2 TaxID=3453717 RepID=UPI003EE8CE70